MLTVHLLCNKEADGASVVIKTPDSASILKNDADGASFVKKNMWENRMTWCLSYPSGGAPFPGNYVSWLGRLIVRIDQLEDTCQPTNIVNCFTHKIGPIRGLS